MALLALELATPQRDADDGLSWHTGSFADTARPSAILRDVLDHLLKSRHPISVTERIELHDGAIGLAAQVSGRTPKEPIRL